MNKQNEKSTISVKRKTVKTLDQFMKRKGIKVPRKALFELIVNEFIEKHEGKELRIEEIKITSIKKEILGEAKQK